jgi:hypothetical protein
MQANFKRGKAVSGVRSVGRFAILAGVPLIATLAFSPPDRAFAACGASRPAGVHTGVGGGAHVATGIAAPSRGGGGGGGSLGCAGGSSASALRGLPTASSGRVVETGAHAMGRPTARMTAHTTATKSTNASAHVHAVRPPHRA